MFDDYAVVKFARHVLQRDSFVTAIASTNTWSASFSNCSAKDIYNSKVYMESAQSWGASLGAVQSNSQITHHLSGRLRTGKSRSRLARSCHVSSSHH
jgi:hypothetical protein